MYTKNALLVIFPLACSYEKRKYCSKIEYSCGFLNNPLTFEWLFVILRVVIEGKQYYPAGLFGGQDNSKR